MMKVKTIVLVCVNLIHHVYARSCMCRKIENAVGKSKDSSDLPNPWIEHHIIPIEIPDVIQSPKIDFEPVITPDLEIPEGYKRITILNSSSRDLNVGTTGSDYVPDDVKCMRNQAQNDEGICFFTLVGMPKSLRPGESWKTEVTSITDGSDHILAGNIYAIHSDSMAAAYPGKGCNSWTGPIGAITRVEFTLSKSGTDNNDVSIIEGANIPASMYPVGIEHSAEDGTQHDFSEEWRRRWVFVESHTWSSVRKVCYHRER